MALDDIEIYDRFRTLDSTSFPDGSFTDAHVCRSLSMSMNTLDRKGHPLMELLFSARDYTVEANVRTVLAPASPVFQRLTPGGSFFRPKDTGFDRATLRLIATLDDDETAHLQVTTLRQPLQPDARLDSGRVLELVGTGAPATYTLPSFSIDAGPMERIGLWIRGITSQNFPGSVALHTLAGAGTNVGRVGSVDLAGKMEAIQPPAHDWRVSSAGDSWATDHYLLIHDGPSTGVIGSTLYQGQIISVDDIQTVHVWPAFGPNSLHLVNKFFAIFRLPVLRVFGLAIDVDDKV